MNLFVIEERKSDGNDSSKSKNFLTNLLENSKSRTRLLNMANVKSKNTWEEVSEKSDIPSEGCFILENNCLPLFLDKNVSEFEARLNRVQQSVQLSSSLSSQSEVSDGKLRYWNKIENEKHSEKEEVKGEDGDADKEHPIIKTKRNTLKRGMNSVFKFL